MNFQLPFVKHANPKGVVDLIPSEPFLLSQIRKGLKDKLGNEIKEIFWSVSDYVIYRSNKGIFVHFSDDHDKEVTQRKNFTKILRQLCELRYLANEFRFSDSDSIYNHNIAQAIMLLMEEQVDEATKIVNAALQMAVTRLTNDNMIRYVSASLLYAVISVFMLEFFYYKLGKYYNMYFIGAIAGVFGAAFSIMTRVQAFEMKPCQQSNMNYLMSGIRICIGCIGGLALVTLIDSPIGKNVFNLEFKDKVDDWQGAAIVGFLGGFAERLVQTLFRRTAGGMEEGSGTPGQLASKP